LIIDNDKGYTIELLKKIESISDLKFEITIVPWIRARKMLKIGVYDMIAHSAPGAEGEEFYTYADELDWKQEVYSDIYTLKRENLNNFKNILVGVPRGGENAAHELAGIPLKNIWSGNLENLFKMLVKGRIDAFWYERGSSMSTIRKLKLDNVFYEKLPKNSPFAGIAVQKNEAGLALKEKLDKLIEKVDYDSIFHDYDLFLKMPDSGVLKSE
jgi:polar amino acid transport system substrate-binding protein